MPFLDADERPVLEAVSALAAGNPFLPERVENEQRALGGDFVDSGAVWHAEADLLRTQPNIPRLGALIERLVPELRERLAGGASASDDELLHYEGAVRHLLYMRYEHVWLALILGAEVGHTTTGRIERYADFKRDMAHFLEIPGVTLPIPIDPAFLFAWGYQIRRAFHLTYRRIYGGSMPAARLRAAVWQSIFTHDVARYRRALFDRMVDIPTLVTGPSGTGKELVARAIALAQFVPFDAKKAAFEAELGDVFYPVNLSALSPTLIESELFGHKRGAFTGAVADRQGWLEICGRHGTVFLDEIGELDPGIQVKLLRVLQSRTFQRIGETQERTFEGKLVAATNRDLASEIAAGRFRADFYYRLCADRIETPTLRAQLTEPTSPSTPRRAELDNLLGVIATRIAGPEEAPRLAEEVRSFVDRELADYDWPGNVRELEQCVRNVLIRGYYAPEASAPHAAPDLSAALAAGDWSAEELLRHYCTRVYAQAGSYEEAARRLGLDRRTVKAKLDPELLARLQGES
ncbi:MAG: sigma 54-interacting transcriptional regulator [Myxococcota bacterium]